MPSWELCLRRSNLVVLAKSLIPFPIQNLDVAVAGATLRRRHFFYHSVFAAFATAIAECYPPIRATVATTLFC